MKSYHLYIADIEVEAIKKRNKGKDQIRFKLSKYPIIINDKDEIREDSKKRFLNKFLPPKIDIEDFHLKIKISNKFLSSKLKNSIE